MQYDPTIDEYQTGWDSETATYTGPTTYRVVCPAHRIVYDGTSKVMAVTRLAEHTGHVPVQDDNLAFAFQTVITRTHVTARFKREEELRRTHGGGYTRIYVSITENEVKHSSGLDRPPYGSSRGDGTAEDKAWRAYNKAEIALMKLKASRIRKILERDFGLPPGCELSFSRKAGCGCGCSPGLVIRGYQVKARVPGIPTYRTHYMKNVPVDIWVD